MNKYELMMILNPNLAEADRATLVSEIETELTSHGATIANADYWGVRDLAYKIRATSTGYYILYTLESDGRSFFDVTKDFNIKKDIWRFMFVKIED